MRGIWNLRQQATLDGNGVPRMSELFAAIDATGELCFVDEVPRGAACGCYCPECASPAVAKQGDSKAWHLRARGGPGTTAVPPSARQTYCDALRSAS